MTVRATGRLAPLLAGILLVTSGCTHTNRSAGPEQAVASVASSPSPTLGPAKPELIAALEKTKAGPFHFAVTATLPDNVTVAGSGAFDGARQVYESKLTYTGGTSPGTQLRIATGKDYFVRAAADKRWVHLDMSRVKKNGMGYVDLADPVGLTQFEGKLVTVTRRGANSYEGTFDASGVGPTFLPLGAASLWVLGYTSTPFTAATDDQGRITAITINMPQKEAQKDEPDVTMTTTFSEYGTALTTKAPAKSQYDEADSVYYS